VASVISSLPLQLDDENGGVVADVGLQPAYGAGHVEPLLQTWFWQVCDFAVQLSHSDPNWPQLADPMPGRHMPVAVQQPAQLSGPQWVPL